MIWVWFDRHVNDPCKKVKKNYYFSKNVSKNLTFTKIYWSTVVYTIAIVSYTIVFTIAIVDGLLRIVRKFEDPLHFDQQVKFRVRVKTISEIHIRNSLTDDNMDAIAQRFITPHHYCKCSKEDPKWFFN